MASHQDHTWFNLLIVLALCFGSLTYGYNFSVLTNTLGQPNFYSYFGLTQDKADAGKYAYTNRIIGACNGVFSAGGFLGAVLMGWWCEARGRKEALAGSTVVSLVGGALSAGSVHIGMFLAARTITGIGVGMFVTLVPIFQSEIAPPATRGFLVAQHGFILVMGYAIAGWVGYATYFADSPPFQWRFPLALQTLWPMCLGCLLPWIPESPRWLLEQERNQEAWDIVLKLHKRPGDSQDTFAREEFYQIAEQVKADKSASVSFLDMFRQPHYRKRMICGGITMWAAEASGNLVIYNFSVILYEGLGFTGSIPLLLSAIYVLYAACLNYVCSLLIDRVGRVRLMLIGFTGCLICLCCETAMDASFSNTTNRAGLRAGVFFLFFFVTFYGGCCDATTFVYCAEIFPTQIRSKGMAWCISVLFLATIPFLEAAPTAFAEVGWKYYLLFIFLTTINIIIMYFYFPETKGLSLEEINTLFGDTVVVQITRITEEQKEALDRSIMLFNPGAADEKTSVAEVSNIEANS
ncbi:hypothetical protein CLAIMM_13641 [Cladophialophora immunda]|nr:hypothetical protein CLAIMM_13641 [Cladophialophora immunda]